MKSYELRIYRKSDNTLVAAGADHDARKEWKDALIAELPAGTHVNNGDYYALNHDPEGIESDSAHIDLIGFDIPQKQAPVPAASEADAVAPASAEQSATSSASVENSAAPVQSSSAE